MKNLLLAGIMVLLMISCKEKNGNDAVWQEDEQEMVNNDLQETNSYSNEIWGFELDYPGGFEIYEGELIPDTPVINIYPDTVTNEPPFAIHQQALLTYVAVIPKGFGVDGPSGQQLSFEDWGGELPLSMDIDEQGSVVYLMENGEPWGYNIRFSQPPDNWTQYGSIFIRLSVENFDAECISENTGETKSMEDCDPLMGDSVQYSGKVNEKAAVAINEVLESFQFLTGE